MNYFGYTFLGLLYRRSIPKLHPQTPQHHLSLKIKIILSK